MSPDFVAYGRNGVTSTNPTFEKPVFLPKFSERSAAMVGWSDGRFAIEVMMEHSLFFMLLMPPELCSAERIEAQRFYEQFKSILAQLDANLPPSVTDLPAWANVLIEAIKPFIDYKLRMQDAQTSGRLRSLVYPTFFDHTRREATRWLNRLHQIAGGESEFDKSEVCNFWLEIMDDHAQFIAHLLDPEEKILIPTALGISSCFRTLHDEPVKDTNSILVAADNILDFKTRAARGIEAGIIKSIIDPVLIDHTRREAVKFIDELKRCV